MEKIEIKIAKKPGTDDLPLPDYMSDAASGVDLCAAIEGERVLNPGDIALIPTGIQVSVPPGYEAQVRPRSGLALEHGITIFNSPGSIDSDHRGEVGVMLCNMGEEEFVIERGMKIAQLVFQTVVHAHFVHVAKLDETIRGQDALGHTGSGPPE